MDSRRLYYGTRSLYRTVNAADNWERIYRTSSPDEVITAIAPAPSDPNTVYAGVLYGQVVVTHDGGLTWPADPAAIFIGTDFAVFHSATGGGSWDLVDEDLPMVAVFDLAAQRGTGRLVAGTHGRGMFEISIEVSLSLRTRPATIADTLHTVGETIAGTMIVAPRGKNDHATSWEAGSDVPWLTVSDAAGEGRGRFAYELSGEGLKPGLNETTLDVTLAGVGDAFEIPVSLYATPLGIEEVRETEGFGVAGWSLALLDSLPSGLTGFDADSAVWSAETSGPGWLVVERAEGGSGEPIVWRRDTEGLGAGAYEDTITILVRGHPEVKGLIVDRVEVVGAIGVEDAALHLLGVDRLDAGQVRFLDRFGNRDGTLNAGDVLRWLDHCDAGEADSGCASGPGARPRAAADRVKREP